MRSKKLKKHDEAVDGMVGGKNGNKKEKEKRSQKKKDSGKFLIKQNFDINDLKSDKKILKAVHEQLKRYQLISDSSQTSGFISGDSDSESSVLSKKKRKTRSKKHKQSQRFRKVLFQIAKIQVPNRQLYKEHKQEIQKEQEKVGISGII
ncbi:protein FAM133B-like [Mytilus trossulus]|uniref:protein FAM133B-like n=1 Tax=Mytilus trossulus TaxID=6551 RepID=UPI003005FD10